jgi:hypothetical protein
MERVKPRLLMTPLSGCQEEEKPCSKMFPLELTGAIGGEADLLIITVLMGTHPGIRRCRRERWPAKGNHMPAIPLGEEDRFDNNEMRRLYNSAEFPLAWRAAV